MLLNIPLERVLTDKMAEELDKAGLVPVGVALVVERKTYNDIVYIVKKGDTLHKIALKFNTTIEKILENNDIENPNMIYVGQKIIIKTEV